MLSTTMVHRAVDMFPGAMFRRAATMVAATMRRRGAITGGGTMGRRSCVPHRGAIIVTEQEIGRLQGRPSYEKPPQKNWAAASL